MGVAPARSGVRRTDTGTHSEPLRHRPGSHPPDHHPAPGTPGPEVRADGHRVGDRGATVAYSEPMPRPPALSATGITLAAPFVSTVLAEDRDSRIESIEVQGRHVLRKTYSNSPALVLRTFLRRSRARREHDNLEALIAAGVPCAPPLGWSENRRMGCVVTSVLVTELLPEARDLRRVTADERDPVRRRRLACRMGRLLAQMHAAGHCSTTMSPRNVLVDTDDTLALCDQPYAFRVGHGWLARRMCRLDLFDTFFSPRRRQDWSSAERWRGVLAYHDGDRHRARATWRRLATMSRWNRSVDRELGRLLSNLLAGRAPSPA